MSRKYRRTAKAESDVKLYEEGANFALFAVASRLNIDSRDIRLSKEPLLAKAHMLADRIMYQLATVPAPLPVEELKP